MLQPGDRLMFIDHISLRGKPISEVIQLLKNTDEIVKLKIKKDEIYTGNLTLTLQQPQNLKIQTLPNL